jgi:non-ribosomal peptide synthetase-like protein
VAVADVYNHPRLGDLASRLDALGEAGERADFKPMARGRGWDALHVAGVFVLLSLAAPTWLVGIFAYNDWEGVRAAPQVGWGWLVAVWLVFASAPGRAGLVVAARRLLLPRVEPGRYPRHSWLACRLWFVERVGEALHVDRLGGTPWAARIARLTGTKVGEGARLGTLPSPSSMVSIGAGATLESDVDVHGWWVEGGDVVVGALRIGAGARIGSRTLLMPGADIGDGAEIEPGSVVSTRVPAGERWAGSPAARVGKAGEDWRADPPPPARHPRRVKALFAAGLSFLNVMPLAAALPAFWLLSVLGANWQTPAGTVVTMVLGAPVLAAGFILAYALLTAVLYRATCRLVRPGWHGDEGVTAWALWFAEQLMDGSRKVMFPLYATVYTRPWLRLLGLDVGRRTEMSTAEGLSPLVKFGKTSFVADAVMLATARARGGWLHLAPIEVGDRTFVGNGAVLTGGTTLGHDSLVGALSSAPPRSADGTSWLGMPPLELPRVAARTDPARTTVPPRRLVVARGAMELVRILLPASVAIVLSALVFLGLDTVGHDWGLWALLAVTPLLLTAAGICAALLTIAAKWVIIGRYRPGEHPLWSFFVWRDEVMNSCQEQLAGAWLLQSALGTPVMSVYLRAMGAKVGRGVWCETLAITEFDQVTIGDGCVVNRGACIETHVFHDRVLSIGPSRLEAMSTLGPSSVVLPDTTLGEGSSVGGRSVVLRGESLPPGTRWHGAPVVSM